MTSNRKRLLPSNSSSLTSRSYIPLLLHSHIAIVIYHSHIPISIVGVDGADENSRVCSIASVDSTVRGVLPIIATEDGAGESVGVWPGGVVGGTHRCFGGRSGGGVDGINRFGL